MLNTIQAHYFLGIKYLCCKGLNKYRLRDKKTQNLWIYLNLTTFYYVKVLSRALLVTMRRKKNSHKNSEFIVCFPFVRRGKITGCFIWWILPVITFRIFYSCAPSPILFIFYAKLIPSANRNHTQLLTEKNFFCWSPKDGRKKERKSFEDYATNGRGRLEIIFKLQENECMFEVLLFRLVKLE